MLFLYICVKSGPVYRLPDPAEHPISILMASIEVVEYIASEGGWDIQACEYLNTSVQDEVILA